MEKSTSRSFALLRIFFQVAMFPANSRGAIIGNAIASLPQYKLLGKAFQLSRGRTVKGSTAVWQRQ
jgi:hypothetical protein